MARYIPVVLVALVAFGLWIGEVDPAWWITGLVALGLLVADVDPAWWITALVGLGLGLIIFMSSR